ncbi:MAG: M43 family zinc metalloprotease [Flavobacteriales bacterium]
MSKNSLLILFFYFINAFVFAQGVVPFPGEQCASSYLEDELLRTDPAYAQMRAQAEQQIQTIIAQQRTSRSAGVVYTIPVVFHIMHSGENVGDSTNISLAQVQSAVAALNRDFRRTNADGGIAQSGPLGVDAEIEFCLAQLDPSGNATSGVTRTDMSGNQGYLDSGVYHTASLWRSDAAMKASIQWNPAEYMNVWVVNKIRNLRNIYTPGFGGGVIGYATLPGGFPGRDGIVILSSAAGNDPTGAIGHNLWFATDDGRTLTHEVGHYLNLYHTFQGSVPCGPSGVNCATTGDFCCDTPPSLTGSANNCSSPTCALANSENYMDYANRFCISDFTPDQVARMRAVLTNTGFGGRNALVNTNNCAAPPSIDLELDTILVPIDTICGTSFSPEIVVCNNSATDSVAAFEIKFRVDAGTEVNFIWSGNLLAGDCDTFLLPIVISASGLHTFSARIDSGTINGSGSDTDPSNNSKTNLFILNGGFLSSIRSLSVCDSFVSPSGQIWRSSGRFDDTLINNYGCDSILRYQLIVSSAIVTNISLSGCDSVVSSAGTVYKTSGLYSDTISGTGCDSIFNITVSLNYASIGDSLAFEWARAFASIITSYDANSNYVDDLGNLYICGTFSGTVDFDPGPGVSNLNAGIDSDAFLLKLDASGNFVWARHFDGNSLIQGRSLAVDNAGNIFMTGYFLGTIDFDPGLGVFNMTTASPSGAEAYVLKLDNMGVFNWAKKIGNSTSLSVGFSIDVDDFGSVYVFGNYRTTVDFDPGLGVFNLTSNGVDDNFILKLNNSGNFVWAQSIGTTTSETARCIEVDFQNNIIVNGEFGNTVDFDPSTSVFNLTSAGGQDVYVLKLSNAGNFVWAKSFGGISNDKASSLDSDYSGSVVSNGYFGLTADFDPGVGIDNKSSFGSLDAFIHKLDINGNYLWSKQFGGNDVDLGTSIKIDIEGNVYSNGAFTNTADFDPGVGIYNLTSAGGRDIFISKLSETGDFIWAHQFGGTPFESSQSMFVDKKGNLYNTGEFVGSIELDPSSSDSIVTGTGSPIFIQKLSQEFRALDTACGAYISPSGEIFDTTGIYYDTLANMNGCDSIVKLDLLILQQFQDTLTDTVCQTTTWRGTVYSTSGQYRDTVLASGGDCDSIYILNLIVDTIPVTLIDSILCFGDSIVLTNGIIVRTSGVFNDTITRNICDSVLSYTVFVLALNDTAIFDTICGDVTYTLPGGASTTTSGIYRDTLISNANCDSIIITNLVVNDTTSSTQAITACDSIVSPSGKIWRTTGTFFDTINNSVGCDSLMTFNITISTEYRDTLITANCDIYIWRGITYTATAFVSDTVSSGICDSIFNLDLMINNSAIQARAETACDSALLPSGTWVTVSGVYQDTFQTTLLCDSIIVSTITINNTTSSTQTIAACDSLISPSGKLWRTTGTFFDTISNNIGCDSLMTFNLTISTVFRDTLVTSTCDSALSWRGTTYLSNTLISDTVTTGICDSIFTLDFTRNSRFLSTINYIVCDSVTVFTGRFIDQSGTYDDTLVSVTGCDSIYRFIVQINNKDTAILNITTCDSLVSPTGNVYRSSGIYTDTLTRMFDCDSIIIFNLTISTATIINNPAIVGCDSVFVNGIWYSSTQNMSDTVSSATGCDTIRITPIVVNNSTSAIKTRTVCDSLVTATGKVFDSSGYYRDTLINSQGCDSIAEYYLTIIKSSVTNLLVNACGSYTSSFGNTYTTSGVYRDTVANSLGCDSIIALHLIIDTIQTFILDSTICSGDSIVLSNGAVITASGTYFDTVFGSIPSNLIYSEDFESVATSFTLNTNDTNAITPGGADNAWIINNSYAGGSVFGSPITATPAQNALVTGNVNSNYLHIHNRRSATLSFPSITNANYIDANLTLLGGQNGLNFSKMTNDISTVGKTKVTFDMYYLCRGSFGRLYYSLNSGVTWNRVGGNINNGGRKWSKLSIMDTVFANQPTIRFAVGFNNTNGLGSTPGFAVDQIEVRGIGASSNNCDSITTINVTVLNTSSSTQAVTVCDSLVSPTGKIWRTTGTFNDTITNAQGCDSLMTFNVTVNTTTIINEMDTACDSVVWRARTLSATGIFYDTVMTPGSCDSIYVLDLLIDKPAPQNIAVVACDSFALPSGTVIYVAGLYRDTLTTVNGCDSIINSNVTFTTTSSATIAISNCGNYTSPSGKSFVTSGVYLDTIPNSGGCDSLITINLTVLGDTTITMLDTACDNYTLPVGTTVTVGGTYRDSLTNALGCDSIIITNLTLGYSYMNLQTLTICAGQTVSVGGSSYGVTGVYRDTFVTALGCDSILVTDLTVNPLTPGAITFTTNMCADQGTETFTGSPTGGSWGGPGIDPVTGLFDPAAAGVGIHVITYTGPGLCGITDSASVEVYSVPSIIFDLTDDECDEGQGEIDVAIFGGTPTYIYSWSNGEATQDLFNLKKGSYTLNVVDANGCASEETMTLINLSNPDCNYAIFVPNIFSPDGNGENDIFKVEGNGIETIELMVYNRWGNLIFNSTSKDVGWDGSYKGQPVNKGAFVYFVKGTFVDGSEFEQKGTVTVIKR